MMATEIWSHRRSDFNHAWLKNRLIATLNRALQVLRGKVTDDAIWNDLGALLADWPLLRVEADAILNESGASGSPSRSMISRVLPAVEPSLAEWLARLMDLRNADGEPREDIGSEARLALEMVDVAIVNFSTRLRLNPVPHSDGALICKVDELRVFAVRLARAFSELEI